MSESLEIFFYLFCVAGGYGLGSKKALPRSFWEKLIKALVWVVYPALLFHGITEGYTKKTLVSHFFLPFAGFGIMLLGYSFSHIWFKLQKRDYPAHVKATLGSLSTMGNYIFLPYPIAKILWGEAAGTAVLLTSLGCDLGVWTLGVSFLQKKGGLPLKKLLNPPLVALLCALIIVYFEISLSSTFLEVKKGIGYLGLLTVPIAMLFLGENLGGVKLNLRGTKRFFSVIAIQLFFIPLTVFLLMPWFSVAIELQRVLFLISSMPPAIASVLLAELYEGDAKLAAEGVFITHLLALVTVPVFLFFCA